jgi:hypothetical protein
MKIYNPAAVVLIFVFVQNLLATTDSCIPTKSASMLQSICSQIKTKSATELQKLDPSILKTIVYDDCGITTPIIIEAKPPYKILQNINRQQQVGLELQKNISASDEVPLIKVSAGSNELTATEFKDISILVSAAKATKHFWGLNCKVADNSVVTIVTSQYIARENLFIGSSLLYMDYAILNDSTVLQILNSQMKNEEKVKLATNLAQRIVNSTFEKTALALDLPEKLVKDILLSKINSDEFSTQLLQDFNESKTPANEISGYYLISGIVKLLENALFDSKAIRIYIQKISLNSLKQASALGEKLKSLENQLSALEAKFVTGNTTTSSGASTDSSFQKTKEPLRINKILGFPTDYFLLTLNLITIFCVLILAWRLFTK